jgi:hypothetical protein
LKKKDEKAGEQNIPPEKQGRFAGKLSEHYRFRGLGSGYRVQRSGLRVYRTYQR